MTRLFNDPTRFADELTTGFVAAHRRWVHRVPGGVIRATRSADPTDDIASAPLDETHKRRGIAGDVAVLKVAGAAAERGDDLDAVVRVVQRANDRTRSYGVAFSGCTLPGAGAPLFEVPVGRMALGLGIHGEPGIDERDLPTADGLAALLVAGLLAEVPDGIAVRGARVAVILNGLGAVKYEELFVVYGTVARLLEEAGVEVVEPEVGELVTSFDMAGVSLTLFWLDDELEELWRAPCDGPAYGKGTVDQDVALDPAGVPAVAEDTIAQGADVSRGLAVHVAAALGAVRATIDEHADELGRIDAVAGDGDHGIGMQRGATAAADAAGAALAGGAGAGTVLTRAGDAWADRAGGTSGALWGLILRTLGRRVGDETVPSAEDVAAAVQDASAAVTGFGKAAVGDKTMVDVLVPFADVLSAAVATGAPLGAAWTAATEAADKAAHETANLLPRMGRARPHAERSLGTPDAGAVSLALIVAAVGASAGTAAPGRLAR